MTYTYKLSRRMALCWRQFTAAPVVLTIALSGCEQGGELKSGLGPEPPANSELVSVTVSPDGSTVQVNTSLQFIATGRLASGDTVTPQVAWSTDGGAINSSGLFTAESTPGTFQVMALGLSGQRPADTVTITVSGSAPPPPPPPGADILLDFDDPNNLGVNCAQSACPFPNGTYRKHHWDPTAGINGSGAIVMHWQTGMSIGFSPVWIQTTYTPHFILRYNVRQTAPMIHGGSAIKLLRVGTGNGMADRIGTLESSQQVIKWWWDKYMGNPESGFSPNNAPQGMLTGDNQWHTYHIEFDYRDANALVVKISFDGGTVWTKVRAGPLPASGPLLISPFAEMYSCGDSGPCSAGINTGDYVVDNFTLTILP